MCTHTDTRFKEQIENLYQNNLGVPALLLAYSLNAHSQDRFLLPNTFLVGHAADCHLVIKDKCLSRRHFVITKEEKEWFIEDLGSKNGTAVNGKKIQKKSNLKDSAVIAAAGNIFVFDSQTQTDVFKTPIKRYEMVGKFHVEKIIHDLTAAAKSTHPLLIVGPSGSGKELAARAYAQLVNRDNKTAPFVTVHAGRFATEEQAMTGLFGVQKGIFSGVDSQIGLVKAADKGVLYLDEIHRLFQPVQVGLLRVIENGDLSHIGAELKNIKSTARFVFASNAAEKFSGLIPDFFARLRKTTLLPLSKRIADIPILFEHYLNSSFQQYKLTALQQTDILQHLSTDHFELMCLYGFKENNVRGIINLCDEIVSKYKAGGLAKNVVRDEFSSLFNAFDLFKHRVHEQQKIKILKNRVSQKKQTPRMSSHMYEQNKQLILSVYQNECNSNCVKTVDKLNRHYDLKTNRLTLANKIRKWSQEG